VRPIFLHVLLLILNFLHFSFLYSIEIITVQHSRVYTVYMYTLLVRVYCILRKNMCEMSGIFERHSKYFVIILGRHESRRERKRSRSRSRDRRSRDRDRRRRSRSRSRDRKRLIYCCLFYMLKLFLGMLLYRMTYLMNCIKSCTKQCFQLLLRERTEVIIRNTILFI